MVLSTIVSRVEDGLPLCSSIDEENMEEKLAQPKQNAKVKQPLISPSDIAVLIGTCIGTDHSKEIDIAG